MQESATDEAAGAADPEGAAKPDGAAEPEGAAETDGAADGTASAIGSSVDPLRLTTTQEAAPMTTIAATAIPMMRCRRSSPASPRPAMCTRGSSGATRQGDSASEYSIRLPGWVPFLWPCTPS